MSRICIAQIGAAHGVRGELRLKAFTEDPLSVRRYGPLESEDGKQRFEIEALRPAKDMLVARLKGIADRNAAEGLKNLRLYVAREKLPAPDDDEFYVADLIGLAAETPGGTASAVNGTISEGLPSPVEISTMSPAPKLWIAFTVPNVSPFCFCAVRPTRSA